MRSYFKFISKNKLYTAIDIFGLSISLAFVILIAMYVERELTIDSFQNNRERIVVLGDEENTTTAVPVAYWLEENFPEIEKVCPLLITGGAGMRVRYQEKSMDAGLIFADSTFFDMFSFPLKSGGARSRLLEGVYDAVISESFANKMFPGEDPIGKSIFITDSTAVNVTGVMKNIDRSIIPYTDIVCRIERVEEINPSLSKTNASNAGSCVAFIMEKPGSRLQLREADILEFLKERLWTYKRGFSKEVRIIPMKEVYFKDGIQWTGGLEKGNRRFSLLLMSAGILILIFSIINYINLTVAQSAQRAKEMALRRLLGSSRKELFLRLMSESTILSVISFAIALLLANALLPYAQNLLQEKFTLRTLVSPEWIAGMAAVILITGILSGLLPSIVISSVKPIEIVRGTLRRKTKMVLSKIFITFQDVITIAMIAASFIMILQIRHIVNAPLGYNTENIIHADNTFSSASEMSRACDMLMQLPCVKSVGFSNGSPSRGTNNLSGTYEDKSLSFQQMKVDTAAFRILGLKIKKENNLADPKSGVYLNELAFKQMELPEEAETFRYENKQTPIAGVLYDFRLWDVSRENSPIMLQISDRDSGWHPWNYLIEVQGNKAKAFDEVRKVFEEVSGVPFRGIYVEDDIREHFEEEIRLARIVGVFTAIAILISLLGLIAMSIYFIRQRMQEMAVRKLFGSGNIEVLRRLTTDFLIYVCIAFAIATPLTWLAMSRWLSGYSYRISLNIFIFIGVFILYLVMSFITVFFQSWRAANENPIKNIRAE